MTETQLTRYLPLVRRIALRIQHIPAGLDRSDLISVGMLGLMKAIEQYDTKGNCRFVPYAAFLIRKAMLDEVRAVHWVKRAGREGLNRNESAPMEPVSLDSPVRITEGVTLPLSEVIPDDSANPMVKAFLACGRLRLQSAIAKLKLRDREIISLYYFRNVPLHQLACRYGLTRGRISQIHADALKRLYILLKADEEIFQS